MPEQTLVHALRNELNEHTYRYHVLNSPSITDAEYDTKFRQLQELELKHPELADPNSPTMRVGHPSSSVFAKVKHISKMLSLDNAFTAGDILDYFEAGTQLCVEPKIDGLACSLIYVDGELVRAVTRGDGTSGDDVTQNARAVKTIPTQLREPVSIEVRGEVYMLTSVLKTLNKQLEEEGEELFANARNAAAGSLKLKDSTETHRRSLSFVAYNIIGVLPASIVSHDALLEYLEHLGFVSTYILPVFQSCAGRAVEVISCNEAEISGAIESVRSYTTHLDLITDGLVFKVNNLAEQADLGEGTRSPKWATAFKFAPERKSTKLLSVTIQVGKTGRLTPVAELEPVELGGTVVQRASMCNQDELKRIGANVGDIVFVEKSAEIIPKIMGVETKNSTSVFTMPSECPCCKQKVKRKQGEVDTYCVNPECTDQVVACLIWSTGKNGLDIDGCGKSTVALLVENNVASLSDLFKLSDFNFLGVSARKKLKDGIQKAKGAPMWRKLSSLNVDKLGVETCKKIATSFTSLEDVVDNWERLKLVCGQVQRENLFEFLGKNEAELVLLETLGFKIEAEVGAVAGVLTGKAFCITGTMPSGTKRNKLASIIEEHGGIVKSVVTSKVHYLIAGMDGGANKSRDAEKFGTAKINEEELYAMMGLPAPSCDNAVLEEREF